jgi:hypothetical protein
MIDGGEARQLRREARARWQSWVLQVPLSFTISSVLSFSLFSFFRSSPSFLLVFIFAECRGIRELLAGRRDWRLSGGEEIDGAMMDAVMGATGSWWLELQKRGARASCCGRDYGGRDD